MSFIYPEYISSEESFYNLWSIDDGSWGFYGYDAMLTKISAESLKYPELFIYYDDLYTDDSPFKIVYKNYEGVFCKKDYPMIDGYSFSSSNKYMLCEVLKNMELTENDSNERYVVFSYKDMEFKLNKVDINYIKTIDVNTKIINAKINDNYKQKIKERIAILNSNSEW
jgi:hypothetical protein